MDKLLEADILCVLSTAEGRHVLRWLLGELTPAVYSGADCAARAALADKAVALEAQFWQVSPPLTAKMRREAVDELLESAINAQKNEVNDE